MNTFAHPFRCYLKQKVNYVIAKHYGVYVTQLQVLQW